jgi:hypothetical protein
MKIVRVTYTTKAEYSEQNQNNIKAVMNDLRNSNQPGINYSSCLSPDGKTFTHLAFFNADSDEKVLISIISGTT